MKNKLEVKNLTKYYRTDAGVDEISFKIKAGEVFGFIGQNGAGKSTTIRSIMNLVNKTGTVLISGEEFNTDKFFMNKKIGYLPSEINLYDDFTVKQMLDYNEKFYDNIHQRRKDLVKRFKLDENKSIEDLSFGNLKKLGIVLAFMHNPDIYILDEPTNGLDPIMQEEFYKLIIEEKKQGKTILYSSHMLNEVAKICDRVGIIKDGKIICIDSINSLINNNLNIVAIESSEIKCLIDKLQIDPIEENGNYIKFKSEFESDKLIKLLSNFKIDKVTIKEPTLEDIVIDYYK